MHPNLFMGLLQCGEPQHQACGEYGPWSPPVSATSGTTAFQTLSQRRLLAFPGDTPATFPRTCHPTFPLMPKAVLPLSQGSSHNCPGTAWAGRFHWEAGREH